MTEVLRHLGQWHAQPKAQARTAIPEPHSNEPFDDLHPMPDYENALTD